MKPDMEKAKAKVWETKKALFLQTATLINGAFALVAAFAWNEAIASLIKRYVPTGSTLYSQFVYAILVTLLVFMVSIRLNALISKLSADSETKR